MCCSQLENAWVFAPEDAISTSIKAYLDYEKALLEPIPRDQRDKAKPTDISGAWSRSGLRLVVIYMVCIVWTALPSIHCVLSDLCY